MTSLLALSFLIGLAVMAVLSVLVLRSWSQHPDHTDEGRDAGIDAPLPWTRPEADVDKAVGWWYAWFALGARAEESARRAARHVRRRIRES